MVSQITLSGYVGSDVEYVKGDGWSAARFRLGSTPYWRRGEEWVNGQTTWMTVRVHGTMAENVRDSVRKGDPMIVSGRLRTRSWGTADGAHHEQLVIEAQALGHDMARGVSTLVRPDRASMPIAESEPLEPPEEAMPEVDSMEPTRPDTRGLGEAIPTGAEDVDDEDAIE